MMMMMSRPSKYCSISSRSTSILLLLFAAIIFVVVGGGEGVVVVVVDAVDTRTRHTRDEVTGHVGSTHEELLSSRAEKRDIFHDRLAEMKQRIEQHNQGNELLTEQEYNKLLKKIKAYEHKVNYLDNNNDLRHLDRLLAREELMNEMHRARISRSADEL